MERRTTNLILRNWPKKESKDFFFEKKKQKTFGLLAHIAVSSGVNTASVWKPPHIPVC
jgi:hypothetical protein